MIERLTGRLSPPATPPATPPAAYPAASPATPLGPPSGARPGAPRMPEEGTVSPAASAADAAVDAAIGGGDGEPCAEPELLPVPDEIARSTPAGPQHSAPQDPPYAYAAGEASGAESSVESGASPEDALSAAAELAEILKEVG